MVCTSLHRMGEQQVRGTASDCGNRETRHYMVRSSCGVNPKLHMVDTWHRVVKEEYSVLNSINVSGPPGLFMTTMQTRISTSGNIRRTINTKSAPGEPGSTVMTANQNAGKCGVVSTNRHPLKRVGRQARHTFRVLSGTHSRRLVPRAGAPARASYEILPYATGTERGKNREASPSPPPRTPPRRSPP